MSELSASHRVGALFGCDTDSEEFQAACKIPLFEGQWNSWMLWRTDRDNPSKQDLEDTARAVLMKWFAGQGAAVPGFSFGHADNIQVATEKPEWASGIAAKKEDCDFIPFIRGKKPIPVWVRFVYRGSDTEMPWPVWKQQVIEPWCPAEADWMVDRVFEPDPLEEVPEPKDPWEKVKENLPTLEPVSEAISKMSKRIGTTLVIIGAAVAVGVGMQLGRR